MQTNDTDELLDMQLLEDEEEGKEDAEIESRPTEIRKSKRVPYLGIILSAMSGICFSLASVIVKWMVNVDPIEIAACRFTGILLPAIPILIWRNESLFPKGKRLILLVRSFTGTVALMLSFYGFRNMPLADASVLTFSVPVFAAVFGRLFLKEPCHLFHYITIALTLFGIVLISRPTFIFGSTIRVVGSDQQLVENNLWGPVAAISSAALTAYSYMFIRALKDIHFSVVLVNYGIVASILTLNTTWGLGTLCWPQCGTERLLTFAVGLFSFAGQILVTLALQLERVGPVSIARSSDIVFAFLWQILIFQEMPNRYSIAGAFLVTASVFLNGIRTWALALPETSVLHKTFSVFEK